jgi:hypothetical protein
VRARESAISALHVYNDSTTKEALLTILRNRNADAWLRDAAIASLLGAYHGQLEYPRWAAAMGDPQIRAAIQAVSEEAGSDDAIRRAIAVMLRWRTQGQGGRSSLSRLSPQRNRGRSVSPDTHDVARDTTPVAASTDSF